MNIELTTSKVDPLVSGNAKIIRIDCDESQYEEAIKLIKKFTETK